jgi:predicted permease
VRRASIHSPRCATNEDDIVLTNLLRDLRYGSRVLLAKLGIGANTLVFALIDGVYMRDLPYRQAAALVDVYSSMAKFGGGFDTVSVPDYVDLHTQVPALDDSALYMDASFNLAEGGAPERLLGLRATPSLFSTLGVGAALGRVFGADDAVVGRDRVVVLSDALWRNRFDADPKILERSLRLDGESYRVVGVLPPDFMFPRVEAGLFVPYAFTPEQLTDDQRGVNDSQIVGRLAAGATIAQVDAQAAAVIQRNIERTSAGKDGNAYAHWVAESGLRFGARPLRDQLSGRNAGELTLLQGACALVLLIALANVANMLLTRQSARHSEFAMRNALGARRSDVVRQLTIEALLLAVAGAVVGLVLACFGLRIVAASGLLPAWAHFSIDARTMAFTLALAVIACVLFGLAPAFASARASAQTALRESARLHGGRAAKRVRATLVVVQLALAVALLAGAGLLLRSFANATHQDPGFASADVLTAHLALPKAAYPDDAARARGVHRMLEALRALPGVDAVGATTKLPFSGENGGLAFRVDGRADDGSIPNAALRSVDENFFSALQIPLLRGRVFDTSDWNARTLSVVVDETFAHRYFPDGEAVGQRITLGSEPGGDAYTIIGVVANVKHFDLAAPNTRPTFYFDLGARPNESVYVALRTRDTSPAFIDAMRAAVRSVDAEQPLFNIATLQQRIATSLTGRRVPLQLLGVFAAAALLLAAIGIYAVLAFGVQQRTGEIGLRMAIGASASRVRRSVLADGGRLIGIGLMVGLLAAIGVGFALRSRLFGVDPIDPASLAVVAGVLGFFALLACWLPAERAARLDPLVALRHE